MKTQTEFDELIALLDEAVDAQEVSGCCRLVKDALHDYVLSGKRFVPDSFMQPAPERYARRLLHKDPKGRYTILVMVWDKGQGTPLHDHASMWCVECVYEGRIKVISYDRVDDGSSETAQFQEEKTVFAEIGDAGALIPPFEYHTISNALETPAVTIHVYGGEMTWCHAYFPVEGGFKRERRELCYTA